MRIFDRFKVTEVEVPKKHIGEVPVDALESLQSHPGFLYLMHQFNLDRAALEAKLREPSESLDQAHFLQLGLHWCGYLSQRVQALVKVQKALARPPLEDELAAFNRMGDNIKTVGL